MKIKCENPILKFFVKILDYTVCVYVGVTLLWLTVARRDPYAVSKKTIDLTAIQLNKELSEKVSNYFTNYANI